jgi:hypothetical protein
MKTNRIIFIIVLILIFSVLMFYCSDDSDGTDESDDDDDNNGDDDDDNGNEEEHQATIYVDNQSTYEFRLYLGTSDDLYDSVTQVHDLNEGEIVISSIMPGQTENYVLDLSDSSSISRDWMMQYYDDSIFFDWVTVTAEPHTDMDSYTFEAEKSYTITINAVAVPSIEQDD